MRNENAEMFLLQAELDTDEVFAQITLLPQHEVCLGFFIIFRNVY